MKKSKLSAGLVASFIGALALSACNSSSTYFLYNDQDDQTKYPLGFLFHATLLIILP